MNENGIPFQIALASFGGYFLVGLLFLFLMGSYENMMTTHEMDQNFASELRRRTGTRSMSENDLVSFFAYNVRATSRIPSEQSLQNSRSLSSFSGLYGRSQDSFGN
jgi:hypothetical protein